MFDISIGTLIPAVHAAKMIPVLNEKGFECYELDFGGTILLQNGFVGACDIEGYQGKRKK